MNFTLVALSIAQFSLTSPFITIPSISSCQLNNQIFSKLHISNSLTSFLHMSAPSFSLKFPKTEISLTASKFQHFLSSAITINNRSPSTSKSFNRYKPIENQASLLDDSSEREYIKKKLIAPIISHRDLVLRVRYCFFVDLSESSSGGAISMLCEESSLYVTRCCFINCFAQTKGGAISFFGNFIRVNDTVFEYCAAPNMAMVIESYVEGTKEKMIFGGLTITSCPGRGHLPTPDNSDEMKLFTNEEMYKQVQMNNLLELTKGKQILYAINSTENAVVGTGGFCFVDEITSFSLSSSIIKDNLAHCIFNLYDMIAGSSTISYCNVLNNTGFEMTLFDISNSSISISNCCLANNNFTMFATGEGGKISFHNCVYDFEERKSLFPNVTFVNHDSDTKNKTKRSLKTIAIENDYIELYQKRANRCSRFTPQYQILFQLSDDIFNRIRANREMGFDNWNPGNNPRPNIENNWKDDDFDIDQKNTNDDRRPNYRTVDDLNKLRVDDDNKNEQKNKKDEDSNEKDDDEIEDPKSRYFSPLITLLLAVLLAGVGAFVYLKYIKNNTETNFGSTQYL